MKKAIYWTKKDGERILVDDMSLYHLKNALKIMLKHEASRKSTQKKNEKLNDQMIEIQGKVIETQIEAMATLRCTVIFLLAVIALLTFILCWI